MEHEDSLHELLAKRIIDAPPHGIGINYTWTWQYKPGKLVFHNGFDCMNDAGFYCGVADFSIIIRMNEPIGDFRLMFHGKRAAYLNDRFYLREYLEQVIHYALTEEFKL